LNLVINLRDRILEPAQPSQEDAILVEALTKVWVQLQGHWPSARQFHSELRVINPRAKMGSRQ
jgi:hypothetical protein